MENDPPQATDAPQLCAMDPTVTGALIGAGSTVVGVAVTAVSASFKERAAERSATASQAKAAVKALINAVFDLQVALATYESHYQSTRSWAHPLIHALTQVAAGYVDDKPVHGAATGMSTALTWRRTSDAAADATLMGPYSRMTASLAEIALLPDPQLREASAKVNTAVANLAGTYTGKRKPALRTAAETSLSDALGDLSRAARTYTGASVKRRHLSWARRSKALTHPGPFQGGDLDDLKEQ